ncbi:MAG: CocE/NonD family hydrolase [Candidatus Promineifilaceae bacterium]|nr:CocE/NonD family hydrolase [Candidatus Promineifilaceae bacterium]
MDRKKLATLVGLAGGAAAGVSLYRWRRPLIAHWLDLPPARYKVTVERGLRVPVEEGVTLAADHYRPLPFADGSAGEDFPTILMRTPYGRRVMPPFYARRFAERGYHVVVQDVRGRGGSDGEFEPFLYEDADGEATVAWLRDQRWFDGRLGMWGQSYLGYVQWALAINAPGAVQALAPAITSSRGIFIGDTDGAPMLDLPMRWLVILDALHGRWWRMLPPVQNRVVAPAFAHLPLGENDVLTVGEVVPFFRQMLGDTPPQRWRETDYRNRLDAVQAPVHLVGGWYDFMLQDLLGDYAALKKAGRQPYLTIGPWTHLFDGAERANLQHGLDWFDAHLKGQRERLRKEPVAVYLMGADEWRNFASWPPPAEIRRYYLHSGGRLNTQPPMAAEASAAATSRYTYDPADPTPSVGGPLFSREAGPTDNRALEARSDVLTFTTPPLARDVDVVGPIRVRLFVRSTLEHTDFFGRLCDLHPDGRSINVCEGIYRLEPAKAEKQEDGTMCLELDLWATANRFEKGHAIRLQISSGAHPHYARNLGTGASAATAVEMRAAKQTIYHDAAHASALLLPVISS